MSEQKPKRKIVIVDDEANIRFALKKLCQLLEVEVAGEGGSGEEAVALYAREQPDLILLDINMPRKNGDQALEEILKINPAAYVMMLTSVADMNTVRKCIALGARNYILKDNPLPKIKDMLVKSLRELDAAQPA